MDSQASIIALSVDGIKPYNTAGDTLCFKMKTEEAYGLASIDIGNELINIPLYDDGTQNDSLENDGIYSSTFVIPAGTDISKAHFTGHFRDHLGNVANPFIAEKTISIYSPPSKIKLFKPELINTEYNILHLTWSMNSDPDFMSYKIYRSDNSKVDTTANLIRSEEHTSELQSH